MGNQTFTARVTAVGVKHQLGAGDQIAAPEAQHRSGLTLRLQTTVNLLLAKNFETLVGDEPALGSVWNTPEYIAMNLPNTGMFRTVIVA